MTGQLVLCTSSPHPHFYFCKDTFKNFFVFILALLLSQYEYYNSSFISLFSFTLQRKGLRGARSELKVRKSYTTGKNTTSINFTAFLSLVTYYFENE